ncbi:hypothetical protein PIB30_036701 [Stylosanthes scabra]|uniref:Non-specific lipid-transfer protein n=1 Tax=Stylosanthes scabra TaxID=79078 RepID=A0ABU6ZB62_9FABA|nr:hypothetical protein [Stylosanthes scabra]
MADSKVMVIMVYYAVIYAALSATTTTVPKAAAAAMSCSEAKNDVMPCLSYVMSGGPKVPQACCNGIRTVYGAAQTTPDRQAVCYCIINSIKGVPFSPFNVRNAAAIPKQCAVNIPYQISPDIDCSKVK